MRGGEVGCRRVYAAGRRLERRRGVERAFVARERVVRERVCRGSSLVVRWGLNKGFLKEGIGKGVGDGRTDLVGLAVRRIA